MISTTPVERDPFKTCAPGAKKLSLPPPLLLFLLNPSPYFRAHEGLVGLGSLRASNEGLLSPRVARARDRPNQPFSHFLKNMPHLILFRAQVLHVRRAWLNFDRHTLNYPQPIPFDTDDLAWIIRDEPDLV